jgi:mono/diheme cytochrome c family protein
MTYSKLARPAVVLAVFAAMTSFTACKSGSSTASTSPSPSSSSSAARAAAPAAKPFTAAMVAEGDTLFHARSCKNCHGMDAKGAANGPNLTTATHMHVNGSYESFVHIITTGVPADSIKDPSHRIPMAPRGGARPAPLTDDQIKAIAAYVYSLSHP